MTDAKDICYVVINGEWIMPNPFNWRCQSGKLTESGEVMVIIKSSEVITFIYRCGYNQSHTKTLELESCATLCLCLVLFCLLSYQLITILFCISFMASSDLNKDMSTGSGKNQQHMEYLFKK